MAEKATQIWKAATGTYNPTAGRPGRGRDVEAEEKDKAKPKKKKKKKPRVLQPKDDDGEGDKEGDKEEPKGKGDSAAGTKIKKGSATIGKDSWPPDDLMNQDEAAE